MLKTRCACPVILLNCHKQFEIIHDDGAYIISFPKKQNKQKTVRLSDRQTRLITALSPPNAITFSPTTHKQTAAALSAIPTTVCIITLKSAKKRHYL